MLVPGGAWMVRPSAILAMAEYLLKLFLFPPLTVQSNSCLLLISCKMMQGRLLELFPAPFPPDVRRAPIPQSQCDRGHVSGPLQVCSPPCPDLTCSYFAYVSYSPYGCGAPDISAQALNFAYVLNGKFDMISGTSAAASVTHALPRGCPGCRMAHPKGGQS